MKLFQSQRAVDQPFVFLPEMQRQRFEAAYRMAPHVKIKKKVANGSSEPFKVSNLKEHFERLTELEDEIA